MRPRKRILYQSYVRGTLFSLRIRKLFPCRRKLLSHILVQFPHELSTAMFFSNKKLRLSKEEKLHFSNIGRTNRLPRITVYILRYAVLHLNSLSAYCSSNLSLIQLIGSTNFHPNNTQTKK